MSLYAPHIYKRLWWNEEIIKSTGTRITYGCNLAVGSENPGPLQKQELLLTTCHLSRPHSYLQWLLKKF